MYRHTVMTFLLSVNKGENKFVIEVATTLERETVHLYGINNRMAENKIN
jgi:hypothetical protein